MTVGRNRTRDFGGELVMHERGCGPGMSGERQREHSKGKEFLTLRSCLLLPGLLFFFFFLACYLCLTLLATFLVTYIRVQVDLESKLFCFFFFIFFF